MLFYIYPRHYVTSQFVQQVHTQMTLCRVPEINYIQQLHQMFNGSLNK